MRKLATIRQIKEILPIEGADKIELAKIDGWQCVVRKNDFKVGDLAIYFEIDSLLPPIPQFDFLKSQGMKTSADGNVGYRIRTIKLRKTLSQGLLIPLSAFPNVEQNFVECYENGDLTNFLNITLYERPMPANLRGQMAGLFPIFIKKTDQERIQNLTELFENNNEEYEVTEKMDGTSVTYFVNEGKFSLCSRNYELKEEDTTVYCEIARQLKIKELLTSLNKNIAIQGEIVGEGIAKNRYKLQGQRFLVFDVWDIDNRKYLNSDERIEIVDKLNLKHVPFVEKIKIFEVCKDINSILQYANRNSLLNPEHAAEGVVFKNINDTHKQSFKVINNEYLLKDKD